MFEFVVVVILANMFMLAALYLLRHVISIRAPVLLMAVGISIIYCILYPVLAAQVSYPGVIYLYVFMIMAGAVTLYFIESRFFVFGEFKEDKMAGVSVGDPLTVADGGAAALSACSMPEEFSICIPEIEAVYATAGEVTATSDDTVMTAEQWAVTEGEQAIAAAVAETGEVPVDEAAAREESSGDINIEELPAGEEIPALAPDVFDTVMTAEQWAMTEAEQAITAAVAETAGEEIPALAPDVFDTVMTAEQWSLPEAVLYGETEIASAAAGKMDIGLGAMDDNAPAETVEDAGLPGIEGSVIPESEIEQLLHKAGGNISIDELPAFAEISGEAFGEDESLIPGERWSLPEQPLLPGISVLEKAVMAELSEETAAESIEPDGVFADNSAVAAGEAALKTVVAGGYEETAEDGGINRLVISAFDALASGDSAGAVDSFFKALKLGPPPKLAVLLCTRISSIYMAQGLKRQAMGVMEMLEVVWGSLLEEDELRGIKTIIIQLRGEN